MVRLVSPSGAVRRVMTARNWRTGYWEASVRSGIVSRTYACATTESSAVRNLQRAMFRKGWRRYQCYEYDDK